MDQIGLRCEKYGALAAGGRRAKVRLQSAREQITAIAGSEKDGQMLLEDLLGFENHTTTALQQAFSQMQGLSCRRSMSVRATLLYPLRHLSLAKVRNLGFAVGEDLWHTVQEWDITEPIPDGRRSGSGRTAHPSAAEIDGMAKNSISDKQP